MPGIGAKSWWSFKEEITSYANMVTTPAARDVFAKVVRDEIEVNENTFQSPALGSRMVSAMYQGAREVGGSLQLETGFEGVLGWLLKHCLGGYNKSGPTNATVYTHLFFPQEDLPLGLTGEAALAGTPAAKVLRYPGVKINSLEFSMEQGGVLSVTADIIARDEHTGDTPVALYSADGYDPMQVTPASPVFPTFYPIKFWYAGVVTLTGVTLAGVRSFKMKIDNKLDRRFNLARLTAEPYPGGFREVTIDFTAELNDLAHYSAYKRATEGTFSISFTSTGDQTIVGSTPVATPFSVSFTTSGKSRMTAGRPKVSDAGIVLVDYSARLIAPTGYDSFVSLVNGATAYGAQVGTF